MKTDLVVAGFLIHEGKVLLIHHDKLDLWLPPGGHIEENETPDEALKREFREETNLDIHLLNDQEVPEGDYIKEQLAVPFYVNVHSVGDHDHCCFYYLCVPDDPNELDISSDEIRDYDWFSKQKLEEEHVPEEVKNIALLAFENYEEFEA